MMHQPNQKTWLGVSIHGGIQKWMIYHGRSHEKVDDLGYPYFRKPLIEFYYHILPAQHLIFMLWNHSQDIQTTKTKMSIYINITLNMIKDMQAPVRISAWFIHFFLTFTYVDSLRFFHPCCHASMPTLLFIRFFSISWLIGIPRYWIVIIPTLYIG